MSEEANGQALDASVHHSGIHGGPKVETTQMSIS